MGAVLSGTGVVLAFIYRSTDLKRRIRRLLRVDSVVGSEKMDTMSPATSSLGYGVKKDTPFLAMEEVTILSDQAEL